MDYNLLAERLFPHITKTPEEILAQYPKRELPEGAKVTRMGPSPTGFMHLGEPDRFYASGKSLRRFGGRASGASVRRRVLSEN